MPVGIRINWKALAPEIRRMLAQGMSRTDMATAFGCSTPAVVAGMRRLGIVEDFAAVKARRAEGVRRKMAEPGFHDRRLDAVRRAMASPEVREGISRRIVAQWQSPGYRERVAASISANRLARIPSAYRGLYRDFRAKAFTPAEAEAMVQDEIARVRRRGEAQSEAARRSPRRSFDETLALVRAGKLGVIELPTSQSADYHRSLIGGSLNG